MEHLWRQVHLYWQQRGGHEAESESATEAVSEAGESEESGEVSYPLTLTGTDGTEITINEEPKKIVSMGTQYDRDFCMQSVQVIN